MSWKINVNCLIAVLMLAVSVTITCAATTEVEWTRQLGTSDGDYAGGISVDSSGNAYITGVTFGGLDGNANAGVQDMFLAKYDTNGAKLWTRQLGTSEADSGADVSVDSSGNAYVTGYTSGNLDGNTIAGESDMFLTKYDTNGAKLWTRQLGTTANDPAIGVSVDGSGNAYITGYTYGDLDGNTNAGNRDMFLVKYDTDGVKQWTQQLGTINADLGSCVAVDDNSNVYVSGNTQGGIDGNTHTGGWDMFLTKYDTDGDKQWTRQLGISFDSAEGVSVDANGNAYVAGLTNGPLDGNWPAGKFDLFLTKYDTNGNNLWIRQLGTTEFDCANDVSVDSSGNAYVTGQTYGVLDGNTNAGGNDMFLIKYDTDGTKLWTQQLGTTGSDHGDGVSLDGSGNAYVVGTTTGGFGGNTHAGRYDVFLVKISSIPEPGSIALFVCGLVSVACLRRWK